MATFKARFSPRQDLIYIFAACAFPIHFWSIINVLQEVPAWIIRLSLWDVAGVVAYTQVFALLETTIVFVGVVLLAAVLPERWFRNKVVVLATMLVFVTTGWFIILHFNSRIIEERRLILLAIWAASYLVALLIGYLLVQNRPKVENAIDTFIKKLAVLSFIYIIVDLLSVVIIIVRNL